LLLSAAVAVFASITSLTRSSAILVLCAVPLIWLPQKDPLRKFAIKTVGVLLVVAVCAIGFSAQVRERLRIHEFTAAFYNPEKIDYERLTSDRANMWHAATLVFKAHPWVGVGPKGFSDAFEALAVEGAVQKTKIHNQPHNDILYSASMGGIFKLLAYLALIFAPFIFFYRSYQAKVELILKIPSILGMQVVATFFLTGLTNSNFDLQIYSTMYAVLVCVLARLCIAEQGNV
jgi:O-antigen ligase